MKTRIVFILISLLSSQANADWAVAPDLTSSTLWQMVAEGRAEVVSSVAFGDPKEVHVKQTVFTISNAKGSDKNIKWAVRNSGFAPVMCSEKWNGYQYHGSSCLIPGVLDPKDLTISK